MIIINVILIKINDDLKNKKLVRCSKGDWNKDIEKKMEGQLMKMLLK